MAHASHPMEALGQSEAFLNFQEELSQVAGINRPVLLIGERGTGKELAAMRLHYLSKRWEGPFVTLNCAALSPSLIESELFGYEKGAFTGAAERRKGRFEAANTGTLFLDEIAMMPHEVQEKILRVVEYGTYERVGSSQPNEVDVRIIGATNENLIRLSTEKKFKRDLLDRLSYEVLFLPPLRYRKGDILYLANHFAQRMAYELNHKTLPVFSKKACEALENYSWHGNVRELKNVVERAVYRAIDDTIHDIIFNPFINPYAEVSDVPAFPKEKEIQPVIEGESPVQDIQKLPLKEAVKALEIHMVKEALFRTQYNQKKAARVLGLSYDQFRGIRKKYDGELSR